MSSRVAPYQSSVVGEYARLLLVLLVTPLIVFFANHATAHRTGLLYLAFSCVLLVTLITSRGNQFLRFCIIAGMAINVFALAINTNTTIGDDTVYPAPWLIILLLVCVGAAAIFELIAWAKSITPKARLKTMAWGLLLIPALIYAVGIPVFDWIWMSLEGDEKQKAMRDPNWNLLNESAFRAAKLAMLGVFAYLGACLGSFLNVVAFSIPRGEPIGLRDSICPDCNAKLSRIDNLPIFSYVNLGAKCRSCAEPISARYLIVELVVAMIFGLLFVYELVTGCTNVPHLRIPHQGILWVILYPKWPAIAIYFFHGFFMCTVLVLALMEGDKYPLKRVFAIVTALAFFAAAAAYFPIQPVPLFDHLPGVSADMSRWLEQSVKLLVGGFVGAAIGWLVGKLFSANHSSFLTFAFSLTGIVLGWQALVPITVIFLAISTVARFIPKLTTLARQQPTTLLLIAILVHHPFWKIISGWWRFS